MAGWKARKRLCDARDMIRDGFSQRLTLADISRETNLSPWHLLREFRVAFHETPHDYLTRIRLDKAKDLLTVTNRPVTEICFDVGFQSLGSFCTLFRRQIGLSPREFRRLVRSSVTLPGRYPWAFVPACFAHFYAPSPEIATFEK